MRVLRLHFAFLVLAIGTGVATSIPSPRVAGRTACTAPVDTLAPARALAPGVAAFVLARTAFGFAAFFVPATVASSAKVVSYAPHLMPPPGYATRAVDVVR